MSKDDTEKALLHLSKLWPKPGAEDDNRRKLSNPSEWGVELVDGVEVLSTPPGLTYEEATDEVNWPKGFKAEPIVAEDGITVGSIVLIPGMFGGYGVYRIEQGDRGLVARSENTLGMLAYKVDSRGCWTCYGTVNLAGIKRTELER